VLQDPGRHRTKWSSSSVEVRADFLLGSMTAIGFTRAAVHAERRL
jgi:hypothetical protein